MKLNIHGDRNNKIFRLARNLWVKNHALRRWLSVVGWDGYPLKIFFTKG